MGVGVEARAETYYVVGVSSVRSSSATGQTVAARKTSKAFGIAPQPVYFTRTTFSSGVARRSSASRVLRVRIASRLKLRLLAETCPRRRRGPVYSEKSRARVDSGRGLRVRTTVPADPSSSGRNAHSLVEIIPGRLVVHLPDHRSASYNRLLVNSWPRVDRLH